MPIPCKHCGLDVTSSSHPRHLWYHDSTGEDACATGGTNAEVDTEKLLEHYVDQLQDSYELVYIDYRDQLTDWQVDWLLSGDHEAFFDDTAEFEHANREAGIDYVVNELVPDEEVRDDLDAAGVLVQLREEIGERDTSDWITNLAEQTPDVLLRINCISEDDAFAFTPVTPEQVLTAVGLAHTPGNVQIVRDALAGCSPEHSVLMGYWIVGADVATLLNLLPSCHHEVEIVNPHLYLGNPVMGSGWITEKPLEGVVRVELDELRTDKAALGYSVDEIYGGLNASSFQAEIRPVPSTPTAEPTQE